MLTLKFNGNSITFERVCKCLMLLLNVVIYWTNSLFSFSAIKIDVNEPFVFMGNVDDFPDDVVLSSQFE